MTKRQQKIFELTDHRSNILFDQSKAGDIDDLRTEELEEQYLTKLNMFSDEELEQEYKDICGI